MRGRLSQLDDVVLGPIAAPFVEGRLQVDERAGLGKVDLFRELVELVVLSVEQQAAVIIHHPVISLSNWHY